MAPQRRLSRYLTVRTKAQAAADVHGDAYVLVDHDDRDVVLAPVLPGRVLPRPAERVDITAAEGRWTTVVRSVDSSGITVAAPAWLTRPRQRGAVRVPAREPVALTGVHGDSGTRWAARLRDLSVTGASLEVETDAGLRVDDTADCVLTTGGPSGPVSARFLVRAVRPHQHALLVVVGVSWMALDPDALAWIAARVSERRANPVKAVTG